MFPELYVKFSHRLERLSGRSRTLVAGPYLGEFGYELCAWQGYVRQIAKFYSRVIVYGRSSSRYFYEDFCTEYRALDEQSFDTDFFELNGFDYLGWARQFPDVDLLLADNACSHLRHHFNQCFIPFGTKEPALAFDIVIHARSIPALKGNASKQDGNWPTESWDELVGSYRGLKVAAVGLPQLSYAPAGVEDLRGLDTGKLCAVLASSRCCVGPSSGLMHLASLCKTPHITWSSPSRRAFQRTLYRYIRSWNPFATPVTFIPEGLPPPEKIRAMTERLLGHATP